MGYDAEGSAGRCCEGQRVVGKARVLLQGCAKVRVGAEGRELSEDVCEAVSVQGGGVWWESEWVKCSRTGGGIPWVKVKGGAHIPEGK